MIIFNPSCRASPPLASTALHCAMPKVVLCERLPKSHYLTLWWPAVVKPQYDQECNALPVNHHATPNRNTKVILIPVINCKLLAVQFPIHQVNTAVVVVIIIILQHTVPYTTRVSCYLFPLFFSLWICLQLTLNKLLDHKTKQSATHL